MTWNATGVMTGIPYLDFELKRKNIDICGLSEHWLLDENKRILDSFNNEYTSHVVVCKVPSALNSRRIGKGGVGFVWKKTYSNNIEIIDVDDDRISVLRLSLPYENYFFIQVYLPTTSYPYAMYTEYVDKLMNLYAKYSNNGQVIILGDFNVGCANDNKKRSPRETYLLNAIVSINMKVLTDSDTCYGPRFTFVPYGPRKRTLIDHIIVPETLCSSVKSCCIIDDSPLNVSRHHPIIMNMGILNPHHEPVHNSYTRTCYNWKFHTHQVEYNSCVSELLDSSEFDYTDVNRTFDTIVNCITAASEANIPKRQFKPHLKPYWSQELKLLHIQMRRDRRCWTNDGKPRANAASYNRY